MKKTVVVSTGVTTGMEKAKRFWIRFSHWEFWPMKLVYLPLTLYYIILSARARSFYFFTATDPGIENGGMFFESKWTIFQNLPAGLYPLTILALRCDPVAELLQKMAAADLSFPVIAKPDRGERGWQVQKITDALALEQYSNAAPPTFLIQAWVPHACEYSVFYVRQPHEARGRVTSLTYKKLLSVTGDGKSTLLQLICAHYRAFLQLDALRLLYHDQLSTVIPAGEEFLLVPYGNHSRGAEFQDHCHLIDDLLNETFDRISKQLPGFYYGRFDLRVPSIADLKAGNNIAVVELNGTGAEPAHIYQPGFSFWKAQKVLFAHYTWMANIAIHNHRQGAGYMSHAAYRQQKRTEKKYKQAGGL